MGQRGEGVGKAPGRTDTMQLWYRKNGRLSSVTQSDSANLFECDGRIEK
nr:Hypothetical protein [Aeromonas sp.]